MLPDVVGERNQHIDRHVFIGIVAGHQVTCAMGDFVSNGVPCVHNRISDLLLVFGEVSVVLISDLGAAPQVVKVDS